MRSPRWLPLALIVLASLVSPAAGMASSEPVWLPAAPGAGASSTDLQLGYDSVGNTVALWRKSSGGIDSVWSASIVPGATSFSTAKRLTPAPAAGETPQIADLSLAVDAQGSAVAVWTSRYTTGAQPDVFMARRASGTWDAAVALSDGNPASNPAVAFQSMGTAFVAWRQTTQDYDQLRVSSVALSDGTITAVQSIAPSSAAADHPHLAFDAQGNGVLTWVETAVTFSPPYTGAVTVRASTRKVAASTFTGGQLVYQTRTDTIDDLKVALDAMGNATIVWGNRLLDSGAADGVFASVRVAGTTSWPGASVSVSGSEPDVASSNTGGSVVTWVEPASGAGADTGAVMAAHRAPGMTSFDLPKKLSIDGELGAEPAASAAAGGTTVVLWARRNGSADAPRAAVKAPSTANFWPAEDLDFPGGTVGAPAVAVSSDGNAMALWQAAGSGSTLQRFARLDGSTVTEAPAPTTPEPTTPTPTPTTPEPTTPAPTTPTPTTPTPTTPTPTTPTTMTPPTPTPATPAGTTPTQTPTPGATTPAATTPVRAPVVTVAKDPVLGSKETIQGASVVEPDQRTAAVLPSLRAFKALAPKRFTPATAGDGLTTRGDGLPLAATGNLPGTLRIVVTSTPKGGKAKNLRPALSAPIDAGTTKLIFTGRLAKKPLPPGLYKLKAVFVDELGRASNRRELSIAIKR